MRQLALMRMSSQRDLDELATISASHHRHLLDQSPLFRQGEALFAGGFVPAPSMVQGRQRFTHEGGRDVSVPLPTRPEQVLGAITSVESSESVDVAQTHLRGAEEESNDHGEKDQARQHL